MAAGMTGSMYAYPRYLESECDIPLPTCMYQMPNIHSGSWFDNGPDMKVLKGNDVQDAAVNSLIQRQQNILSDLDGLRNQIDKLAEKAGICKEMVEVGQTAENKSKKEADKKNTAKNEKMHHVEQDINLDIVITALPSNPPLSAFVLFNILKERGIMMSSAFHIHSSLREAVPVNIQSCVGGKDYIVQPHIGLTMTIIWKKDMHGPSLLVSPRLQTPIRGDANIARFLCRRFAPDLFESLNEDVVNTIEHWISVATTQINNGTPEQAAKAIQALDKQLTKQRYLASNDLTIADIIMWSAIASSKQSESLPKNARKWFLLCNKVFSEVSAHLH